MNRLKLHSVSFVDELAWPSDPDHLTLHSPALTFFTDFSRIEPLVIEESVSAVNAHKVMIKTHVRLKFVVNRDKQLLGVVSAEELSEQNIMLKVMAGANREEVSVTDLMTRKQDLLALDIRQVEKSTISDVVNFLKDNHQQHCLVVDQGCHQIRGIFSASDISRKLRLPINIHEQSSFYRVFSAVS